MTETVVTIRALVHTHLARTPMATAALRGASLTLHRGEIGALIGPGGAGKTTLVSFINGLQRPIDFECVVVFDQDMADPSVNLEALRRKVGLVFQHPHHQLFERFVGDDIAYGPRQLGLEGGALRERVRQAMQLVGLDFAAFKDRATFTLSGGEMRRAAMAGVLAMQPELLILDEATTGLDPEGRDRIHSLLRRLRDEQGLTVLIVSNDMSEVAELADRVTVLVEGRTVAEGTPRQVFYSDEPLERHGLLRPPVVHTVERLRAAGVDVPGQPLTAGEAEEAIWQALKG
jgi:energy-coupling factor transporter ATP-binding protein EcfA2